MSRNPKPIFVQKRIYRQRRLADAAKLLPVFGCALILLPLLWQTGGEQQARTTGVMLYLFLVWVLLAVLAWLISRNLSTPEQDDPPDEGG